MDIRYNKIYEGKHWTDGYDFYLDTEECPDGVQFADGPDINPDCDVVRHETNAATWRNFDRGDEITWDGDDRVSEVQDVLYRYESNRYRERAYVVALTVEQCVELVEGEPACVTDNVQVDAQTWRDYDRGDTIVFAGEPGEVVSQ